MILYLPYDEIEDSVYGTQYVQYDGDTLYTDWFNVGPVSEVSFKCLGNDPSIFSVQLQKQSDSSITILDLPAMRSDTAGVLRIYLLNGLNENYRLLFVDLNLQNSHYIEDLYIGGIPVDTTIYGKTIARKEIVANLNPGYKQEENKLLLIARPNPATDMINVKVVASDQVNAKGAPIAHKFKVKLVNLTGGIMYETETDGNTTLSINTDNYSPGTYFIRAEEIPSQWGESVSAPVVEKIIIAR